MCYSVTAMLSMGERSTRSRRALLLWVSLWLLMVPWVHVHPEVEHNHGDPAHAHHAIMHTVFSAPLECESHQPHPDDTHRSVLQQPMQLTGHHGHVSVHPEIDYVLASTSPCPTIDKAILSLSTIEAAPSTGPCGCTRVAAARSIAPTILALATTLPLRAPPAPFS